MYRKAPLFFSPYDKPGPRTSQHSIPPVATLFIPQGYNTPVGSESNHSRKNIEMLSLEKKLSELSGHTTRKRGTELCNQDKRST